MSAVGWPWPLQLGGVGREISGLSRGVVCPRVFDSMAGFVLA